MSRLHRRTVTVLKKNGRGDKKEKFPGTKMKNINGSRMSPVFPPFEWRTVSVTEAWNLKFNIHSRKKKNKTHMNIETMDIRKILAKVNTVKGCLPHAANTWKTICPWRLDGRILALCWFCGWRKWGKPEKPNLQMQLISQADSWATIYSISDPRAKKSIIKLVLGNLNPWITNKRKYRFYPKKKKRRRWGITQ